MKKLFLSFLILFLIAKLSVAQIPNFSFENWTSMGAYSNPDEWGTMNNTSSALSVFTATKGTPGNPGASYLNLTSKTTSLGVLNGIAVSGKLDSLTMRPISGFAFNLRPQTFSGKWQHMIYGTSPGIVSAVITKWNTANSKRDTVALAYQLLSGMVMSWANFSLNFTYQSGEYPDSCIIELKASGPVPTNQDYLYVDALAFNGSVAGIENNSITAKYVSIYPNPSSSLINIDFNTNSDESTFIELINVNGEVVLSKNAGILSLNSKQTIDISSLTKGVYFLRIITASTIETKKLIIQ
ncbi:MAG: T9SS type A sorting domain-containing protein [Bacteroidota bacterium]